jgi:hypothetical protein
MPSGSNFRLPSNQVPGHKEREYQAIKKGSTGPFYGSQDSLRLVSPPINIISAKVNGVQSVIS